MGIYLFKRIVMRYDVTIQIEIFLHKAISHNLSTMDLGSWKDDVRSLDLTVLPTSFNEQSIRAETEKGQKVK